MASVGCYVMYRLRAAYRPCTVCQSCRVGVVYNAPVVLTLMWWLLGGVSTCFLCVFVCFAIVVWVIVCFLPLFLCKPLYA